MIDKGNLLFNLFHTFNGLILGCVMMKKDWVMILGCIAIFFVLLVENPNTFITQLNTAKGRKA